jgi:hypothetical protein
MIMTKTAFRGVEVPSLRNLNTERAYAAGAVELDGPYEVRRTETGTRCGNHGRTTHGAHIYHANPASVSECYRLAAEMIADQEAEIRAELAYERHLEDRGYDEARWEEDREFWGGVSHY